MWTIRYEQLETMRQAALRDFEDYMVQHLHGFIPRLEKVLGDAGLRQVIHYGIARARPYGFTSRACVRFFIETILLFGAEFDTDPQYPWARQILTDERITDQTVRGDRLCAKAGDFLDHVAGTDRKLVRQALRRARHEPFDGPAVGTPDFISKALERLQRVYPEKYAFLGAEALDGLIRRALEETRHQAITTGAGGALVLGLMFTVGHGMTRDPHLPWIAGTLGNQAIADPNKRAERLYAKAMTYLDGVLNSLD
jgi:hypothetical protein